MSALVSPTVAGVPLAIVCHRRSSVRILAEHRLDRPIPGAVEFFQQLLRRRDASRDEIIERHQIARLVAPFTVEPLAARQARTRERKALLGEVEHRAVADRRAKTLARDI